MNEQQFAGTKRLSHIYSPRNEKHAIGFAIAYDTYTTWWGRSLCLYNLYVRDGHRGKGVGKQLFTEVVRHARDSGCTRVDFQVLDWNPFQKFYEDLNAVNLTKAEGWQMYYMTEKDIKKALDEHGGQTWCWEESLSLICQMKYLIINKNDFLCV